MSEDTSVVTEGKSGVLKYAAVALVEGTVLVIEAAY